MDNNNSILNSVCIRRQVIWSIIENYFVPGWYVFFWYVYIVMCYAFDHVMDVNCACRLITADDNNNLSSNHSQQRLIQILKIKLNNGSLYFTSKMDTVMREIRQHYWNWIQQFDVYDEEPYCNIERTFRPANIKYVL